MAISEVLYILGYQRAAGDITGWFILVMYVIPSHGCILYHMIVMPSVGTILNGVVVFVIIYLSTLHW